MRTCDAVGIQEIFVLNTRIPIHRKWGSKSSSSANKWLTVRQFTDAEECFATVRKNYSVILTTHLSSDAVPLYELNFAQPIAMVFGNEKEGVSEEIRAMADGNFIIPQVGMIRSLNISVACAVTLYEAFRQKTLAGHYDSSRIGQPAFTELLREWKLNEGVMMFRNRDNVLHSLNY